MLKKLLILVVLTFSGCALGSGVSNLVDSSGTRASKLTEKLKLFSQAYYWGKPSEAAQYVIPEKRSSFAAAFRARKDKERIFKNEVVETELSEGDSIATVEVDVQYFSSANLIVKTRTEIQTWEFRSFAGGWMLKDLAIKDDV